MKYIQFLTRNPNLQSELTNSFTLRRKLRKTKIRKKKMVFHVFEVFLRFLEVFDVRFGSLVKNCIYFTPGT